MARLASRGLAHLLLVVFGTLASLVLVELALRLLGEPGFQLPWQIEGSLHRPDEELIYSLQPNAESRWETQHFVEDVTTNSFGLRGAEPGNARRRILVLGDSMTFGHGVSNHETYPYLLEQSLRKRGRDVEVLNGAVKGYGIDQSYQSYRLRCAG